MYARRPPVHEGRLPSYGSLVFAGTDIPSALGDQFNVLELTDDDHVGARELANGLTTFLVRTSQGSSALVTLERGDELALVRLATDLHCWVVQRHPNGMIRIFGRERLLLFQNDRWSAKPYGHTRWLQLAHVTGIPSGEGLLVGAALLDLCLHLLSARHIGATFVWMPSDEDPNPQHIAKAARHLAAPLKVTDPDHIQALSTVLASVDGACLVDSSGGVRGVEAFLSPSKDAERLIKPAGGTRHTSAARFSFDEDRAVVFVVSADGPVTVFSDGMDVLRLDQEGAYDRVLAYVREERQGDLRFNLSRRACPACQKSIILEVAHVDGGETAVRVDCPVCGEALESLPGISVRTRVAKPWEGESATVSWGMPAALVVGDAVEDASS